ncbi:hypothetical protein M501DRAFT_945575 [Patellaria atrata CBS 101060]|uniref:HCNGP-domain-containing protein n=1 Tax=Patellaria atrata CBS 101060 TaxID=1346257 RepID=A0A9P4VVA4_9PEZI|nr:hypothetical protein M501DRAFT_945575 [Patellaria atrata CBS 101060]
MEKAVDEIARTTLPASSSAQKPLSTPTSTVTSIDVPVPDATPSGPSLGPSAPPTTQETVTENESASAQSPYSSTRATIRNLTMPSVPNFEIPPSPPGSPPRGSTAKFARFLELKKQGVHFNEKLEKSTALRNPSLLHKLMDFAGISEEDSYASTLSLDLAIPTKFPEYAYAEELNKSQALIRERREKEKAVRRAQGEQVEFVPSRTLGHSNRTSTPTSGKGSRDSTSERVMATLNQGKSERGWEGGRKSRFDDTRRRRSRSPR